MADSCEEKLRYWFAETPAARRWKKDAAFDALILRRFAALHELGAALKDFRFGTIE